MSESSRRCVSALEAEHYDVVVAPTGEDGFFRANAEAFDLVLLDLMLPGRGGLEILETLRKRQVHTPVLVLTARDSVDDRVRGLDLGADDYLIAVCPARAARPHSRAAQARPAIRRAAVEGRRSRMDLVARRAMRGVRALELTSREFELLEHCCAIKATWSPRRCWHTTSGRSRVVRRPSTTSSTCR